MMSDYDVKRNGINQTYQIQKFTSGYEKRGKTELAQGKILSQVHGCTQFKPTLT